MRSWSVRLAVAVGLAACLVAANRLGLFEAALAAIAALGPWAAPAFVALHAASVVAFVPSVVPGLAAGALFGVGPGLPLALLGAGLGACAALWIGRTLARDWIEEHLGHDPRFEALSRLARHRGPRIVALARLSPLFPFAIGNYAFGLTPIRGRDYLLASVLGSLPSTAVFVHLGTLAADLGRTDPGARTGAEWGLLAAGFAATLALALYLRRLAKHELERPGPLETDAGCTQPERSVRLGARARMR